MKFKVLALLVISIIITASSCFSQVTPTPKGFAHNDYLHKHPLFDALDNGFTNIEADIFLHDNKLVVAHYFPFFKDKRTLEDLYLKPLKEYLQSHNGAIYDKYNKPIILMIDIKTSAQKTYASLKPLLEKYSSMLSHSEGGVFIPGNITIVLSGNKPYEAIKGENYHLAFIDQDLKSVNTNSINKEISVLASCKYSSLLHWNGNGSMPATERLKLTNYIKQAHESGLLVRLWGIPDQPNSWNELLGLGIDLINTDKLADLHTFLAKDTLTHNKILAKN